MEHITVSKEMPSPGHVVAVGASLDGILPDTTAVNSSSPANRFSMCVAAVIRQKGMWLLSTVFEERVDN